MKTEVLNAHTCGQVPDGAVDVRRPHRYQNPYHIGRDGDRLEVVQKFWDYFDKNEELKRQATEELQGRYLLCCCVPLLCHASIIAYFVNTGTMPPRPKGGERKKLIG